MSQTTSPTPSDWLSNGPSPQIVWSEAPYAQDPELHTLAFILKKPLGPPLRDKPTVSHYPW